MGNQRFSIVSAAAVVDAELTDSIFRTLAVIGMYGDRNGWCWPKQKTLAALRGVSRKTINQHIKVLSEKGYLNIQPRFDEETGAQTTNMMQVRLDMEYENDENVTGGVTSKGLQGGGSPGGYRGGEAQEVTHNTPINTPIKENIYIEPDPPEICEIKTALALVSKTPLWSKTEEAYDSAAYTLAGWDASADLIRSFRKWWEGHGYYKGKPSLKSIVGEWQNFTAVQSTNGKGKTPHLVVVQDGELELTYINGKLQRNERNGKAT